MGTPELAARVLQPLIEASPHRILAVYAQPDRPSGRGLKPAPPPVKILAQSRGIEVIQPERFKDPGVVERLEALAPDLIVVAAYGLILPQRVLDIPRQGALNIHPSLLPRWRGAAPLQAALLNGDRSTGVTLMQMDRGMDTGDIIRQESVPLDSDINAAQLGARLADRAAGMLIRLLEEYPQGGWPRTPQVASNATYAPKITREQGLLDFQRSAIELHNRVRALVEWPTAFLPTNGGPIKVLETRVVGEEDEFTFSDTIHRTPGHLLRLSADGIWVACGEGTLCLQRVLPPGKKPMDARSWANGARLKAGDSLGEL